MERVLYPWYWRCIKNFPSFWYECRESQLHRKSGLHVLWYSSPWYMLINTRRQRFSAHDWPYKFNSIFDSGCPRYKLMSSFCPANLPFGQALQLTLSKPELNFDSLWSLFIKTDSWHGFRASWGLALVLWVRSWSRGMFR